MSAVGVADMVDVQEAASIARRDPETVRRWVRSGRLPAQRRGNRLLVSRMAVEELVGAGASRPRMSLAEWQSHVAAAQAVGDAASSSTAADLVLDDRNQH